MDFVRCIPKAWCLCNLQEVVQQPVIDACFNFHDLSLF